MTTATQTQAGTQQLREAVAACASIIPSRSPKPVLSCVRMEGDTVTGTNLEQAVQVKVAGLDVQPAVCVPAARLLQILTASRWELTELEFGDGELTVKSDGRFKLYTIPASEFPPVTLAGGDKVETTAERLRYVLDRVSFAAANENTRYAINGVLLNIGRELSAVATDGRRLAICGTPRPSTVPALLPLIAVMSIKRLLKGDGPVTIHTDGGHVTFSTEDVTLTTNLIEGAFPPYKDVLPKQEGTKVTLEAENLRHAMQAAAICTNEESKGVRVSITSDGLTLTGRAPESGESEIPCPAQVEGQGMDIGINPAFVLEAVKGIEGELVAWVTQPNRPMLLTASGWQYVVMPVNLS